MKSLDIDQTYLVASSGIAVLPLVKLITYTDKPADMVDETYYISKRALRDYDYGDPDTPAPQTFAPWLASIDRLISSMVHMPGTGGSGVGSKFISITLHNSIYQDSRVAAILGAHTLEGARIEVSELLVQEHLYPPNDLSAYTGDEHTVIFRGVVRRILINNSTITLECESEFPEFDWPAVLDASLAAPRDVGLRLPVPYGDTWVLCPSWDVGGRSNTTTPILTDDQYGTLGVVDSSGLPPSADFHVKIGSEILEIAKSTDSVYNIKARGEFGTVGSPHPAGMPISELKTETIHVVSLYPISALKGLYVRNPFDGQLLQVLTGYSYIARDLTLITGKEIANVRFSQQQLIDLLEYIEAQQPTAEEPAPPAPDTQSPISSSTIDALARDGNESTKWDLDNTPTDPRQYSYTANFNSLPANTESVTIRIKHGDIGDLVWIRVRRQSSGVTEWGHEGGSGWYAFEAGPTDEDWYVEWRFEQGTKSFDFYEFERIVYEGDPPAAAAVPVEIQAATFAADMEVYASVDGVAVPPTYGPGYAFDDSGTWEVQNCTTARETGIHEEGTACRKVTVDISALIGAAVIDCDSSTDWTAGSTVVTDEGHTEGAGCLEFFGSYWRTGSFYDNRSSPLDLSDTGSGIGIVLIDFKIKKPGGLGDDQYMKFEMWSGAGWQEGRWWNFLYSDFPENTWVTVALNYLEPASGAWEPFDPTDVTGLRIQGNNINGDTGDLYLYFDNIRIMRDEGDIVVAQNNAIGGVDLESAGLTYAIRIRVDGESAGRLEHKIEISDETKTGTTQPTEYRTIDFSNIDDADATWRDIRLSSVVDTGSPDETDVENMRIVINPNFHGINAIGLSTIVYVDDLRIPDDALSPYEGVIASAIEYPVDVARHWIATVGAQTVDEATWGTSHTNLGTNILAGDARGWGATFLEVLDHLGYITRSNFVQEEIAANSEWRMLQALSGYGWGASARTLDMFPDSGLSQGGREDQPGRDLASARTWLYDYKPWIGTDDSAFVALIRIGSDQNDASAKVAAGIITAAVAAIGEKPAPMAFLKGIADEDTAIELAGYYYTEGARIAAVIIAIRDLSWSQGYDLEVGDIVAVVRPWVAGSLTLRLIEVEKNFRTQRVSVQGVSV